MQLSTSGCGHSKIFAISHSFPHECLHNQNLIPTPMIVKAVSEIDHVQTALQSAKEDIIRIGLV